MAVVTDKIKSVVDFLVKGFEPRETIFDEMAQEVEEDYPVQDNLALQPEYSFQQPSIDRSNDIKVVSHPGYRGFPSGRTGPRSLHPFHKGHPGLHDYHGILLQDRKSVV